MHSIFIPSVMLLAFVSLYCESFYSLIKLFIEIMILETFLPSH